MATDGPSFDRWLAEARIAEGKLSAGQRSLLEACFRFLQRCGDDYYSRRLLGHFLLHCDSGLTVADIGRLLGISRPTASRQHGLSSKEAIQAAHHRMAGRPHGKLLPRYAGPIAQFLTTHPKATRWDVLDFIEHTWKVRVSTVALSKFMKKYGLDRAQRSLAAAYEASADSASGAAAPATPAAGLPVPQPSPEFFLPGRSTREPSSSCRPRWSGWRSPRSASRTTTDRCGEDC